MIWSAWFAWLSAALAVAATTPAGLAPEAWPGRTAMFDFDTERYMATGQSFGGLSYVTDGVPRGAEVPLVVFLHGLNPYKAIHPWFNGEPGDLRPIVNGLVRGRKVGPFVLAGPTQSKNATIPQILWPDFDVDAFADAVEASLEGRARVMRRRVILIGHSGGACNPKGGVVGAASRARLVPFAVMSVDSCLEPEIATALLAADPSTKVWVYWQRATWPRRFEEFRRLLEGAPANVGPRDRRCEEVTGLVNMPHDGILPAVLTHELPELIPPLATPD